MEIKKWFAGKSASYIYGLLMKGGLMVVCVLMLIAGVLIYSGFANRADVKMLDNLLLPIAKNPHVSPTLLRSVYTKTVNSDLDAASRDRVFLSLMDNPNIQPSLFTDIMLSFSRARNIASNYEPATFVSPNPNFSSDHLLQLAAYPNCEVRRVIVYYPNISDDILSKMIKDDPDVGVRRDAKRRLDFLRGVSVAGKNNSVQNRMTVPDLLSRQALNATNASQLLSIYNQLDRQEQPGAALENVAANCFITQALAQNIFAKAQQLPSGAKIALLKALATNPNMPPIILTQLAMEKDLAILRALAFNPNLPQGIINKLALFPDCKIRKKIVCIPSTGGAILKLLEYDADQGVALEANERLNQGDNYLSMCQAMRKLNPSCAVFYGANSSAMQLYPNTSENTLSPRVGKNV